MSHRASLERMKGLLRTGAAIRMLFYSFADLLQSGIKQMTKVTVGNIGNCLISLYKSQAIGPYSLVLSILTVEKLLCRVSDTILSQAYLEMPKIGLSSCKVCALLSH